MRIQSLVLWLGAAAIYLGSAFAFYHVLMTHMAHPERDPVTVVATGAALLALTGWLTQAWLSVRASKKQHSINVLFQSRMSAEWHKNAKLISDTFPKGADISVDVLNADGNREIKDAVHFVLNYYEFIAVGIESGDLDHRIIGDCIRSSMLLFCKRSNDYIKIVRQEDDAGRPSVENQLILRALRKLERRWKAQYWRLTGNWPIRTY